MRKSIYFGALVFAIVFPRTSATDISIGYTSFCEIVGNPNVYDQRIVLTSGIVEFRTFEDPACRPQPKADLTLPLDRTLVDFDTAMIKNSASRRLNQLLDARTAAFVVVEGRFESYRRYAGQLPEDPKLQELLRKANERFGYDNCCRFRFTIRKVRITEPVAESASSPPSK